MPVEAAFSDWIGRTRSASDQVTPGLVARLRATLDRTGDAVPQGLHWCLCLPDAATEALGLDGHPPRDDFLPPVPLPRRMWASSEVVFHAPIQVGDRVEQQSRITGIEQKAGASGALVFVTVDHQTRVGEVLSVSERQTIVYRDAPTGPAPRKVAPEERWDWRRTVLPTTALLFRYSALAFNSHRIHYDLPYARDIEGYDALVVHGPLTATLLLDLVAREAGAVATFSFRGEAPAFVDQPLHLCGRRDGETVTLAAYDDHGVRAMSANATLNTA